MGVQGFQEFIEKHCPSAVVPVELQKLARGALVGGGRQRAPQGPLRLLLDAESCLHRLYGGSYTDWVSGGQWNHMLSFLSALSRACFCANIQLQVCFNGALEKGRLHEWVKRQVNDRQTAQQIICHIHKKGIPPPKVWFLPPVCMGHCIRLALLRVGVGVVQTMEDHHLEVLTLFRENGFHGLIAYDSDYALSNISHYFSSQALKLSRNGKSITTSQYLLREVAKHFNMHPSSIAIFAALLGNHILLDEDLAAFHWSLLGPDHPLASLKMHAHQLVLPPCEVVIKAVSNYVCSVKDLTDLETIAKDVFKNYQACIDDKVDRFRRAVEYYSITSNIPTTDKKPNCFEGPLGVLAKANSNQLNSPDVPLPPQAEQSEDSVGKYTSRHSPEEKHTPLYERASPISPVPSINNGNLSLRRTSTKSSTKSDDIPGAAVTDSYGKWNKSGDPPNSAGTMDVELEGIETDLPPSSDGGLESKDPQNHIPSLLSMPTRSHMDITAPALPTVAPDVMRVAEHRHKSGLMYPNIYNVLSKGEIKLSVTIEDDTNTDLPSAVQLFRPIRQYVYGVLFSVAQTRRKAEILAMRKNYVPEYNHVLVKEWAAYKGKAPHTPELVEALTFREWTCPNLKKLWLGKAVEDKNCRMRAFLACMRSDTPAMLNPANIPTPLLVLCCVLRFMLHWPGIRVLRRNELDAFLAQALSPKLYETEQLQELKIDNLDPRGIQLAALFMSGVDMALFANDACGQPVPWEHCCPWMYFDGKLFQSKLIQSNQGRAQLIDLCDGQAELVLKVEKMRQSILEGLNLPRPPHPLPFPVNPLHRMPLYPLSSLYTEHHNFQSYTGRGRRLLKANEGLSSQGGKLEIAGTVVGQWAGTKRGRSRGAFPVQVVSVGGPNRGHTKVISTPLFRTFGRGEYLYARTFWNQGIRSKSAHSTTVPGGYNETKGKTSNTEDDSEPEAQTRALHSALMCNTNSLLNALNINGGQSQDDTLEAAVLKEE